MYPEAQIFYGRTLSEGLAWCLVWLMVPELGSRPLLVSPAALGAGGCAGAVAVGPQQSMGAAAHR
jgi:hypothetical protein